MSHPLTDEQAAVVDAIRVGQNVTVSAYAGAGKTHTLVAAAKALDGKSGIFTAFNSMIVKESAAKFPASVTAKTSHSLATGICQGDGAWRWARMDKTWNRVVGRPLAQLLGDMRRAML